jgi:hypothetical protein
MIYITSKSKIFYESDCTITGMTLQRITSLIGIYMLINTGRLRGGIKTAWWVRSSHSGQLTIQGNGGQLLSNCLSGEKLANYWLNLY